MPNQVPPKKPYTEEMFQEDSDLYIKGYLGGFDKDEMTMKLNNVISKIEDSGVMSSDEAKDFIKNRAEIYKKFSKERPGETLPDFKAMGGRIGFLKGGDTEYNAMVTKKYIELGGEEGTGMDIDTFANEYFKKFNKGGRVNYAGGSGMGASDRGYQGGGRDTQGNVSGTAPGAASVGDGPDDRGSDRQNFIQYLVNEGRTAEEINRVQRPPSIIEKMKMNPYLNNKFVRGALYGINPSLGIMNYRTAADAYNMYNTGQKFYEAVKEDEIGKELGGIENTNRSYFNEGTQAPDTMAIRKRVEELMDDGETFGDAVKQAVKEIGG